MTEVKDSGNMLRMGTLLHGTYRIDAYLASGGFGNTYEATNVNFGERYAIKEFFLKGVAQRDDNNTTVSVGNDDCREAFEAQMEKFKSEAKIIRKLHNPHIVKLYDLFEENGTAYYVMEYIDGKSVAAILKDSGQPFDERTAIGYVGQVLDALREVHNRHFYHLDIKPSNIMISDGRAILIDFGSSKQMKDEGGATTDTPLSFTPGYAPSELIDHDTAKFGPWTDFYSLGATLYNMVSMQKPPAISDIIDDGEEAFHFAEGVSQATRRLVMWMMSVTRASRPQRIDEIDAYIREHYADAPREDGRPEPDDDEEPTIVSDPTAVADDDAHTVVIDDSPKDDDRTEMGPSAEPASTTEPTPEPEPYDEEPARHNHGRMAIFGFIGLVAVALIVWLIVKPGQIATAPSASDSTAVDTTATVHGETFYDAQGNAFTYSGPVNAEGKPEGSGHGEYSYGIYEGHYHDGMKEGQGKFFEKSGNIFTGRFSQDFYAQGEYLWKEAGRVFKGTFHNEGQFCDGTWYDKASGKATSKMVGGRQQEL